MSMLYSFLTQVTKVTIISAFVLSGLGIPTVAESSLSTMTNSTETETLSNETQADRPEGGLFCRMIGYGCWW